jgi:hypothetical protein
MNGDVSEDTHRTQPPHIVGREVPAPGLRPAKSSSLPNFLRRASKL